MRQFHLKTLAKSTFRFAVRAKYEYLCTAITHKHTYTMRITLFLVAAMLTASNAFCQKTFFNGFGNEYQTPRQSKVVNVNANGSTAVGTNVPSGEDEAKEQKRENVSDDSVSTEQTSVVNHSEVSRSVGKVSVKTRKKSSAKVNVRLRLYDGEDHPLTMRNLLAVLEEVGVTNQIIVLAQSLLETGFFTSNVCKTHNNLFGLYDSRNKCYYSFERWEDSVVGYRKFIQYRYKSGNYFAFLKRIGYAEDPQYITKVGKITKKLCEQGNILD